MFRHIQTYPDVIGHIQVKLGVIQAYFEPYVTLAYLQNSGRFRILAYSKPETYSEPWYIQNSGTFRTRDILKILDYSEPLGYSESEAYSQPYQASTIERLKKQLTAIIVFASYNHFRSISFSCPLVHEINIIFLMQV